MKYYFSRNSSQLLLLVISIIVVTQFSKISLSIEFKTECLDQLDPLDPKNKVITPCPMISSNDNKGSLLLQQYERMKIIKNMKVGVTKMVQITFNCKVDDLKLCSKVEKTFDKAVNIISSSIKFINPITVNATFMDFCAQLNQCGSDALGGAVSLRNMIIKDYDDDISRIYPQALVKQLNSQDHPEFLGYDILALFNSEANYWFEEDEGGKIGEDQLDFLFVVVHELIHGLGFTSGWNDYINNQGDKTTPEILTPQISAKFNPTTGEVIFEGFIESIFDKYLVIFTSSSSTGDYKCKRLSDITKELNKFAGGIGAIFKSRNDFFSAFKASPQYQLALKLMRYATIPKSIGFLLKDNSNTNCNKDKNDVVILETSISPYVTGSSICHLDYNTYSINGDFLMRFIQDRGITLNEEIQLGGNYKGGSIGPKLRLILESLGYITQK
ncbi:21431_t:CDS:2 [Entrophospora sp. SA101]|nr:21431_t:CDS:2 [Entrophospora sp. SA101]